MELLDALPYLTGNLSDAPEPLLRKLFEAVSPTVRIADDGDHVIINVRLPGDTMPEIISAAEKINTMTSDPHETPGHGVINARVDAVRAPGAARTASTRNRTRRELLVSATVGVVRRRRRSGG